jgi:hypothetical protein
VLCDSTLHLLLAAFLFVLRLAPTMQLGTLCYTRMCVS